MRSCAAAQKLPGLCAVASGSLKLSVWARPRAERVLGLVAAGESFGEAAALLGAPRRSMPWP